MHIALAKPNVFQTRVPYHDDATRRHMSTGATGERKYHPREREKGQNLPGFEIKQGGEVNCVLSAGRFVGGIARTTTGADSVLGRYLETQQRFSSNPLVKPSASTKFPP